jgi:hypothetical protein
MLKVGPTLFTIAISLSAMSFSHSTIAAICGPGDHWVDTCAGGIDSPLEHWGEAQMELELGGSDQVVNLDLDGGPFQVYRGDPEDGPVTITPPPIPTNPPTPSAYPPETFGTADSHNDVIRTEIISLIFEGTLPSGQAVTIRAGDGNGNLENDGPLYSPGVIYESPTNPAEACSIFWVTFEMEIEGVPEKFYGQGKVMYCFTALQGLGGWAQYEKVGNGTFAIVIYNSQGQPIGKIIVFKHPTLDVKIDYFNATAQNGKVNLSWATAEETDHAGFVVVRGQPKTAGVCTDNPADYANIVTLAWVSPDQPYSLEDPISNNSQCYGLLDVGFDGQWGLHVTSVK